MSSQSPGLGSSKKRLSGWKEIGKYIGKTARTAQRWEDEFGLPVHRIPGNNHEIVFAYEEEIDKWQLSSERLRFETLLADISARFVNIPSGRLDTELQGALETISSALEIDHFSLWQYSPDDPDHLSLTHIARKPPLASIPTKIKGSEVYPYSHRKILANEVVYVPDISNPPEEVDQATLDSWRRSGLGSVMAFPLSAGGRKPIGSIGIGSTRPREWSEVMRMRLQMLAGVFANALARKFADQKLSENELRLKLAAESAEVGLFTLDPSTGKMWASEISSKLAGLVPGEELDYEKVISLVHPQDRHIVKDGIEDAMRTGNERTITFRIRYPDGSTHRMMSRGRRHRYSPHGPFLLMGVIFETK